MVYLKSIGAGLLGSVLAIVLFVLIQALWFMLRVAWESRSSGSGGIAGTSVAIGPTVLLAAVVGFALGFWWMYRRQSGV